MRRDSAFAQPRQTRLGLLGQLSLITMAALFLTTALFTLPTPGPAHAALPPTPSAVLGVPTTQFIGEPLHFTVTFDNTGDAPGYGPYLDLLIPTSGVDNGVTVDPDSLDFTAATYLGVAVDSTKQSCVAGATLVHPLTGRMVTCPASPANAHYQLVTLRLPYGSFTPEQPAIRVDVTASLSADANLGVPLSIAATPGFEFGATPTGIPLTDSLIGAPTSAAVTPTVLTLAKTYLGPESETATGPNFPRQYRLDVDVATGQTLTNLDVTDLLPNNVAFLRVVSSSPAGASVTATPALGAPAGSPNRLTVRFPSVTGTASATDATVVFEYFIPRIDATSASVIDPTTGAPATSPDAASTEADWLPTDTRDRPAGNGLVHVGGAPPITAAHTLTDRSLAVQKTVAVASGSAHPDVRPGATLEYRLNFQVSDYFAFDNVSLTDVFSDGQHLDPTFTPTLRLNGNGYGLGEADFGPGNWSVTDHYTGGVNPIAPIDGTTELSFRVSDEVARRGADRRLFGGCVPLGGGASDCAAQNDGPTTGTVVFRTVILENYTDRSLGGDPTVTQKDTLGDDVTVRGDVLNASVVGSPATPTGSAVSDTSHASVVVVAGTLGKAIVAVDGGAPGSPVLAAPGRTITYRLTYDPPASDFKRLRLIDYLPLPVLAAAEVTAFDAVVNDRPAAGHIAYGSGDSFHLKPGAPTPTLAIDAAQNAITLDYGSYNDLADSPSTIELLFTVTVSDNPFADGLYLTNQLRATDSNTDSVSRVGDAIIQFRLTEPVLGIKKGIVATDNSGARFAPTTVGPVAFSAPGSVGARFAAPFGSPDLTTHPIDANLTGVDAGDLVTFAVVVENTGSGLTGAYNVQVKDTLPAGFVVPTGGLNLTVTNASREAIGYTDLGGGLFGNGIRLVDPAPNQGALAAGKDGGGGVITNGRNIAVITYDLQVADAAAPGQIITNTASLVGYANSPGGPTFLASPLTDDATTTIAAPALVKTLESSEIENAANARNRAVVGELVTYKLALTIPEGVTTNAKVVDTLPTGLAFVDAGAYVPSSTDLAFPAAAPPSVTNNGRTVTFNLGTVTNANRDNATAETISVTYRVVVLNVAGNAASTSLTNSAALSWTGGSLAAVKAPSVTVVEPALTTTKSAVVGASGTTGDAGDPVAYTIVLKHAAGAFDTDAFDVTFSDPLPKSAGNQSLILGPSFAVADSAGLVTAAKFELVGSDASGWTLQTPAGTAFDFPLAPAGRTITITVNGTVSSAVYSGQSIQNNATATWTSLAGAPGQRSTYNTSSTERTGADGVGGALNKYAAKGTATITVFGPSPVKSVVATSESRTTGNYVAVGEIVRYRLVTRLAQGVTPGFKLVDALPTGLSYLNDGTTKVALVSSLPPKSNGGAITSSTLAGAGLSVDGDESTIATITPTFVLPSGAITPATFVDGTDPTFSLGDLTNAARDGHQGYVVVEFSALVDNVATNQAFNNATGGVSTTNRDNTFAVWANGASVATSGAARVTIAEPVIRNLVKVVTTPPHDAGDTVVYTLTYSNTASGSTAAAAFDVRLVDTLGANLVLQSAGVTTKPAYASVTDSTNLSVNAVDLTLSELRPGDGVTVTITAKVKDTARAGQNIPNTASLTYASLPGPNGTVSNPTGSSTPGGSGTATGRRDGSNGTGGLNDYLSGANAGLITLATPSVDKLAPSPTSYPVGEVVSYDLVVTLPEGVTSSLKVIDALPSGLSFVDSTVITTAAASGGAISTDFAGSLANPTPTAPGGSAGGDVTLDFGDVMVSPTAGTTANTFVVRVRARVANVAANRNGVPLQNTARLSYTNPNDGSTPTVTSAARTITVVEPLLNVAKSRDQATPDAGDVVTYTVTLSHKTGSAGSASGSAARDVVLTDVLPAGLTNATVTGVTASGIAAPTAEIAGGALRVPRASDGAFDLPLGATVTVTCAATVADTIQSGESVSNTADVTWTSLAGASAFERGSGDGLLAGGGLNDYEARAIASFTVPTPTFEKTLAAKSEAHTGGLNVAVGEVLTYRLALKIPEGVTPNVTFVDTLPAGLAYIPGSATAASSADVTSAGALEPVVSADGLTLTFSPGDVTNRNRENAVADTIAVTYRAVVLNASGNQAGVTLDNSAVATWNGHPLAASSAPAVTIVEPVIGDLKKVITTTPRDAGDPVVYTLAFSNTGTADAYDVSLVDQLPAELTNASVSGSVTGGDCTTASSTLTGGVSPESGPGQTISAAVGCLKPGGSVTLTLSATVADTVSPGAVVANRASLTYSSLPGARGTSDATPGESGAANGERNGSTDPAALNHYRAQASADFPVDGATFAKTLRSTSAAHTTGADVTIGEVVTYSLAVTLPEGTTPQLRVVDSLPAGLGFLAASVDRTGFLGTVPEPATNAPAGTAGDVTLDFGETLVSADNDPTNNTFVVLVTARVLDVSGNLGVLPRTALDNRATLHVGGATIDASPVTVTVVEPRLVATKHISALSGVNHDTATVTLSVQNTGTATAFDLVLDDPLPSALFREIAPGTTPAGFTFGLVADGDRTIVRYTGASLAATPDANAATFTFTVRLAAAEVAGQVLTNTATVTRAMTLPGTDPESAAARNEGPVSASDTLNVPAQVNLGIRKTQVVDPVQPFGLSASAAGRRYNVDYTLTYSNDGTTTATGVVLTEMLASGATLRGPASTWVTTDGVTYEFVVGDLAPGASGSVRFDVRSAPLGAGDAVANTVTIADDHASGPDVDPTDNSASVSYTATDGGPITTVTPTVTPTATPTSTPLATATPGGNPTATPTRTATRTPTSTPTSTPLPAATSVPVVPNEAAQLVANRGSVEVVVPAGALEAPATLVYTPVAPPARTFDYAALQAFALSWQGVGPDTLAAPAVLTIGYDPASLSGLQPDTLTIRRLDASGNWVVVPSYHDPVARTVSAATSTLGRFALTAEPIKYWIWLPGVLR